MNRAEVLIVGGGVVGCAIARHLAQRGLAVEVLERGSPGMEASSAAAGMLSPLAEAKRPGPFLDMLVRARREFPAHAAALREETGIDVDYRGHGTLMLALRAEDEEELAARYRWERAAGMEVERLDDSEARRLEPAIGPGLRWALCFPGDHQVDNRKLARALWTAAVRAGARFSLGAEARRLLWRGERVDGVELADGERREAAAVVLAGGSWAGRLENLPRPLPVFPVHGQLLALETVPPPFAHVVDSPRAYLVPRADGRTIVGATAERSGFRKAVTPAGVLQLLNGALEIAPALRDVPLLDAWAGLRPGTPDDLPILGRDPQLANLFYATGHYRNGILLAPLTGETIGDLLLTGATPVDLAPFSIERFD